MNAYNIGDVLVTFDAGGYPLQKGPYTEKFRHEGPWDGERIALEGRLEPLAQYREYPLLLEQQLYSVYEVNGERLLLYHWSYLPDGYGIWLDRISRGRSDVCSFDPAMLTQIPMTADWFFGVSGLHKALLMKGRPVLHASYIEWKGSGILFTAPSGTGKSTQAKLWNRYENTPILNGDRVLLAKKNGIWHAYGFPNCGSSEVCENRTLPVRAIVVLQQGPENRILPMTAAQKLRSIAAGVVNYNWDSEDIHATVELAGNLATQIPVVKLVCRADREAVEVLKMYLEGEEPC